MRRRTYLSTVGVMAATSAAGCIGSNDDGDYPDQPIEWVIPFGEGGGTDSYARQIAPAWGDALGVNFEINNQPGAGGLEGAGYLHGSDPNGYSIATITVPAVLTAWLFEDPNWDLTDFVGVGKHGTHQATLVVNSQYDHIEDIEDLIAAYQDGEFSNIAIMGHGHTTHIMAHVLYNEVGMEWEDVVPYDGGAPTTEAVIADEVSVGIVNTTQAQSPVESGDMNAITLLGSEPSDIFPDLESLTEAGYPNIDYISVNHFAIYAPPETEQDRIDILTEGLEEALQSEDVQEWSNETNNRILYEDAETANELLSETRNTIEESVDLDQLRE